MLVIHGWNFVSVFVLFSIQKSNVSTRDLYLRHSADAPIRHAHTHKEPLCACLYHVKACEITFDDPGDGREHAFICPLTGKFQGHNNGHNSLIVAHGWF